MLLENVDLYARTTGGLLELNARDGDLQIGMNAMTLLPQRMNAGESVPADQDVDPERPNLIAAELIVKAKGKISFLGATIDSSGVAFTSESVSSSPASDGILLNSVQFSGASLLEQQAGTNFSYVGSFDAQDSIRILNSSFLGEPAITIHSRRAGIYITDSDLSSASKVKLMAKDAIELNNASLPQALDLPIGFESSSQLAFEAPTVRIKSTARSLNLRGVFIASDTVQLSSPETQEGNQAADLNLSQVYITTQQPVAQIPVASSVNIQSLKGAVRIGASSAGDLETEPLVESGLVASENLSAALAEIDADSPQLSGPVTFKGISNVVIDSAEKYALLNDVTFTDVNSIQVTAEKDITFANVSISSPTDKYTSKVLIASRDGNVVLDGGRTAQKVIASRNLTIVSRVALTPDGTPDDRTFTGGNILKGNISVKNHTIRADSVAMSAKNQLDLANVKFQQLTQAQVVNLSANTTVLKDVHFGDGSTVNVLVGGNSGNVVAGDVGTRTTVQPGLLNIMTGVKYGDRDVRFDSPNHMNEAAFKAGLESAWVNRNQWTAGKAIPINVSTR
jgi:hypothetical protein